MAFKKEKATNRLILKHLAKVDQCLKLTLETVEEYLKAQGRFSHLDENAVRMIQGYVDQNWEQLRKEADEIVDG